MHPEMLGKSLMILGGVIFLLGIFLWFGKTIGLGRLPGDILIKSGNFTFYFPLMTGIIISIVLTIILNIFFRR